MDIKQKLTPACRELFERITCSLPSEMASRLRCSASVRNHGSYRTFYLFNIWDQHQGNVWDKDYCCYGLRYDPLRVRPDPTPWHFVLWINKIRIYRDIDQIRHTLDTSLSKAASPPFRFSSGERAVQLKWYFDWPQEFSGLPDFVAPKAAQLIRAAHPVLMSIFDRYEKPVAAESRQREILGRQKQYFGPATRPAAEAIREYTRSIPPSWREKIMQRHQHQCAHCRCDLRHQTPHMDHILPFSRGGKTVLANLQPLCAPCNLAKGNRHAG